MFQYLGFFQIREKKATDITQEIWKQLEMDGLDVNDCRVQGYDNDNRVSIRLLFETSMPNKMECSP